MKHHPQGGGQAVLPRDLGIEAPASQIRCTLAQPSFYGKAGPVVFYLFPMEGWSETQGGVRK